MSASIKRKSLSVLLVLAMVISLFAGLGITASAAPGIYTVTFASTNATVMVGSSTVTTAQTDATGSLSFMVVPTSSNYLVESITTSAATAVITMTATNQYTISNVEADNTVTIYADVVWNGTIANSYDGGDGNSAATAWQIANGAQLAYLAQQVNNGTNYSGKFFKLTSDIFLNYSNTSTVNVWTPIGTQSTPFAGTFDGFDGNIGHLVCLIYYNDTSSTNSTHKALFGSTSSTAVIQRLGVTGTVGAYNYASGLVGYNEGLIDQCFNAVSVTGNDSGSRGSGGLAGANTGTISNSYNIGTVANLYRPAGGITGIADASSAMVKNSYSIGNITSAGGAGYTGAIMATLNGSSVSNDYYLVGSAPYAVAYPASTAGVSTAATMQASGFPGTLNGATFTVDSNGVNGGYPVLTWERYTTRPTPPPTPTPKSYTVSFSTTGVSPIADIVTTTGSVVFSVTPSATPTAYVSVFIPTGDSASVTKTATTATYNFAISNITSDLKVVVASDTTTTYTTSANSGIFEVLASSFTLVGGANVNQELLVDCTEQTTSLKISNLKISNALSSVINFAGTGNILTLSGMSVLEEISNNNAAIHVPSNGALTLQDLDGTETLYLYKSSLAAGIGGNNGEVNGTITFNGGNYFLKGTLSGAVIGTGQNTPTGATAGTISISNAQMNIATVSNGAAIGGGINGAISTVTIANSSINIVCDWNGAAIGVGSSAATAGSVVINPNNSSLYTLATANRQSATPLVTATVVSNATPGVPLFEADVPGVTTSTYSVTVDLTPPALTGTTNLYAYTGSTTTTSNWTPITSGTVGVWIPAGSKHTVTSASVGYTAIFNPTANKYITGNAITLGPTGSGATYNTVTDAQANVPTNGLILVLGTTAIGSSETINTQWPIVNDSTFTSGSLFTLTSGSALTVTRGSIVSTTSNYVFDVEGGTFTIAPSTATGASLQITGTIYLASDEYINVGATVENITGNLTILCETAYASLPIAEGVNSYLFTNDDLAKFVYEDGSYDFELSGDDTQILLVEPALSI
jgi:hypothetical protein